MCGNVGVNVLLLYIKNRVPTSLFHHVGGVCSYSKCVENVGVNVLLLYIKNRVSDEFVSPCGWSL